MDIGQKVFDKTKAVSKSLAKFGFNKKGSIYNLQKPLSTKEFIADITVDSNLRFKPRLIDRSTKEEYLPIHLEFKDSFVQSIAEEYTNILNDIKAQCSVPTTFRSNQANRISDRIISSFKSLPQFPWQDYPSFAIFKHTTNSKWFAVVMLLEGSKFNLKDVGEVEVINLKLDPSRIKSLVKKAGFYPAYHMNKNYWISITLNDLVDDDTVFSCIEESFRLTLSGSRQESLKVNTKNRDYFLEWVVPCNPKYYDIQKAFKKERQILWKQSSNIKPNDTVYLYVTSPLSAIKYKCKVCEVDIPYKFKNKFIKIQKLMKIKLQKTYPDDLYAFQTLKQYGLNSIRGPRLMPKKLSSVINKKLDN